MYSAPFFLPTCLSPSLYICSHSILFISWGIYFRFAPLLHRDGHLLNKMQLGGAACSTTDRAFWTKARVTTQSKTVRRFRAIISNMENSDNGAFGGDQNSALELMAQQLLQSDPEAAAKVQRITAAAQRVAELQVREEHCQLDTQYLLVLPDTRSRIYTDNELALAPTLLTTGATAFIPFFWCL